VLSAGEMVGEAKFVAHHGTRVRNESSEGFELGGWLGLSGVVEREAGSEIRDERVAVACVEVPSEVGSARRC
jgi:hypothetical protein